MPLTELLSELKKAEHVGQKMHVKNKTGGKSAEGGESQTLMRDEQFTWLDRNKVLY